MNIAVYNSITMILVAGVLIAFGIALYSFIFMLIRWKTPQRRSHAVRLFTAIAAIPFLVGAQQAILWWVFLPALGRQQMAEINAAHAKQFDETTVVKVGDTIPKCSLTTIDGHTISLPLRGKVVLINFFATWCGPCQMEMPHIERIWSELRNDDHFRLVVVGREETAETVRAYHQQHGFSFPIAADPEREVYSLFAKELIPRTIIVSPEGQVVYSNAGFYETEIEKLETVLKQELATLK